MSKSGLATPRISRRARDGARPARRRYLVPLAEAMERRAQPGTMLASPLDLPGSLPGRLAQPARHPASGLLSAATQDSVATNASILAGWDSGPDQAGLATSSPFLDASSMHAPTVAPIFTPGSIAHGPEASLILGLGAATKGSPSSGTDGGSTGTGTGTGTDDGGKRTSPGTPPTGNSQIPPGATAISGPGEFPIRPGSSIFVSDNTTGGDANALWWDAPSGTPITTGVSSWNGVVSPLTNVPDGSQTDIFISGHGDGDGGTATSTSSTGGGLDGPNLATNPGAAGLIAQKLKPGGRVVFLSCGQGANAGLQSLANQLGVPVIGNTGTVNSGANGNGDWVQFNPQK